jgi:hypothetical protein
MKENHPKATAQQSPTAEHDGKIPYCGVVMPISATISYNENHWQQVQAIIHRAIVRSNFVPLNVWEGDINDRISERIVENIFKLDVIVADISDLNSNVMLELGLRLASKKPTIVITNDASSIPFDIKDFEALIYHKELRIFETEDFIEKLSSAISSKYASYTESSYRPFLRDVVIDVIAPETRETTAVEAILSAVNDLGDRISRIERSGLKRNLPNIPINSPFDGRSNNSVGVILPSALKEDIDKVVKAVDGTKGLVASVVGQGGTGAIVRVESLTATSPSELLAKLKNVMIATEIDPSRYRLIMNV